MTRFRTAASGRALPGFFAAAAGLLALTGFAQMPIFKRYYVADVPGLGWLAQYYTTHTLHYLGAIVLMSVAAYVAVEYWAQGRRSVRLTVSGWIQAVLLAGLIATGLIRVVKNFEAHYLSEGWIVFLDIAHIALAMGLLGNGAFRVLTKKRWTTPRPDSIERR
jgi:hypothetical protein